MQLICAIRAAHGGRLHPLNAEADVAIDGKYQDALLMALVDHSGRTSTQS
jgi:hypothetical protein